MYLCFTEHVSKVHAVTCTSVSSSSTLMAHYTDPLHLTIPCVHGWTVGSHRFWSPLNNAAVSSCGFPWSTLGWLRCVLESDLTLPILQSLLLGAGVTGVSHTAQSVWSWRLNTELHSAQVRRKPFLNRFLCSSIRSYTLLVFWPQRVLSTPNAAHTFRALCFFPLLSRKECVCKNYIMFGIFQTTVCNLLAINKIIFGDYFKMVPK